MSLVLGWSASFREIPDLVYCLRKTGWCPAIQVFTKDSRPMFLDWLDRVFLVVHSPFNLNLLKPGVEWMIETIAKDLLLVNRIITDRATRSRTGVVVHLGKNTEQLSFDECVEYFCRNVEKIMERTREAETRLILETSVKSKNDVFWSVENLGKLSTRLKSLLGEEVYESRIGYCVDTAHVFASGYDIRSEEGMRDYLRLWEEHIGVRRITLLHLNDSKGGLGCCRDLHQSLGKGELYSTDRSGVQFLLGWCQRAMIPVILETGGDWQEELEWLNSV